MVLAVAQRASSSKGVPTDFIAWRVMCDDAGRNRAAAAAPSTTGVRSRQWR